MKRYWFGLFCSRLLLFVYYSFIYTRSECIFSDGICYYYNVVQCIFTYSHLICELLNHVNWKKIRFIPGFIVFEHLVTIPSDGYFSLSIWKVQKNVFDKIICILFLCTIPIVLFKVVYLVNFSVKLLTNGYTLVESIQQNAMDLINKTKEDACLDYSVQILLIRFLFIVLFLHFVLRASRWLELFALFI